MEIKWCNNWYSNWFLGSAQIDIDSAITVKLNVNVPVQ
jgi:hypothetical protein